MKGKEKKVRRGLSDAELVAKYEAGAVNVGAVVKKMLTTKLPGNFPKLAH